MPHIRLVEDEDSYIGAIYINGTKVLTDECIHAGQLIEILRNNLGIDANVYRFNSDELDAQIGDSWPDKLRDFGNLIDKEDIF